MLKNTKHKKQELRREIKDYLKIKSPLWLAVIWIDY